MPTAEGGRDMLPTAANQIELAVGGMTCASCAARIEKKLNRLDGVQASVNYATEKATVCFDPTVLGAPELVATVESAGYTAQLPKPPTKHEQEAPDDDQQA